MLTFAIFFPLVGAAIIATLPKDGERHAKSIAAVTGAIVLAANNALGSQPFLLILTMALGGIMAVCLGMMFGALLKDVSTLFAIWKSSGILLFGPSIIYMFPGGLLIQVLF